VTWISGSAVMNRARGSTSRIASVAAIDARISWRFSSEPRPRAQGLMRPSSPPAQAQ
jgi:hypothetical protein